MSRLIVKNLPNKITGDKLKEIFNQKGEVTDVQLKFTKDGKFRNFGFIGYRTEEQAAEAREYFNGSCIKSMTINVDICVALGDTSKPRAWSKYAPDSTAYKKIHKEEIEEKPKEKKKKKKDTVKELLKKHKDDPLFAEFIEAHIDDKTTWIKEALEKARASDEDSGVEEEVVKELVSKEMERKKETKEVAEVSDLGETKEKKEKKKKLADKEISDLEYKKSLMKKKPDEAEEDKECKEDSEDKPKKIRNRPLFHIKITNLPYKCKKKDIKEFFRPLVPYSIRFPLGKGKKVTGFCYVGFRTEPELKKALNKDKLFLGSHQVRVQKYEDKAKKEAEEQQEEVRKKTQQTTQNEESIGESGSIFVRNLPYITTEDELTKLFEKYGLISDVNMPIDSVLRQPKGFATVTYLLPEHAVKAYTELDGTVFSGRMLHLLPAKTRETDDGDEGLTFKEKKAKQLKAQAKSSHNWNTLFLGANAVADVVAANYDTTKERLLNDNNKNTSAAVRLALGETQLVAETRSFLEENGVYLDAFNQIAKKRSKTCILVKNLPAQTTKEEIKPSFEKFGHVARFVMPKHGITALVDFIEPFEAKKAFSKLAYSQFKTAPLYLEWAPENVFLKAVDKTELKVSDNSDKERVNLTKDNAKFRKENEVSELKDTLQENSTEASKNVNTKEEKIERMDEDFGEPENDTTLFIKNLNFRTTEESLRAHFSPCGSIHSATIAKKKDPRNPGQFLSMGYGFVQFHKKTNANQALKDLQTTTLDGKTLELKRSERGNTSEVRTSKKSSKDTKQNGTKILVRNVPFQANSKEIHEIFRAFGEIKTVRLPKKLTPGAEQHRGFCFVDFHSKADAKSAFDALSHSTHLYGRRMVLEWADQTDENENVDSLRKRTALAFNASTPGGKKAKKSVVDVDTFVE